MQVTARQIATDTISSKLIYFVKGDDGGGVGFALHGDRGLPGAKGLKGDSGDRGPVRSRCPNGKRGAAGGFCNAIRGWLVFRKLKSIVIMH